MWLYFFAWVKKPYWNTSLHLQMPWTRQLQHHYIVCAQTVIELLLIICLTNVSTVSTLVVITLNKGQMQVCCEYHFCWFSMPVVHTNHIHETSQTVHIISFTTTWKLTHHCIFTLLLAIKYFVSHITTFFLSTFSVNGVTSWVRKKRTWGFEIGHCTTQKLGVHPCYKPQIFQRLIQLTT